MGARYPRFAAENLTQVAGSYGGVSFMVVAVLLILVDRGAASPGPRRSTSGTSTTGCRSAPARRLAMAAVLLGAAARCSTRPSWRSMRGGVRALESSAEP